MSPGDVPTQPEGLTRDRLAAWLHGQTDGAELASVEVEPTGSQAFASQLYRVHLRYHGAPSGPPASVVVKLASKHEAIRGLVATGAAREVRFFQELGQDPGIAVPRCYHASAGEDGFFCLVLEDLGAGQIGKSRADHAATLIEALAPFHARYWNGAGLSQHAWLAVDEAEAARAAQLFGVALQNLAPLGARVPEGVLRIARRLHAEGTGAFALGQPGPGSLVHGDLHLQQVFFPGERGGRFAVLDWATVTVGNPLRDVSRALSTSVAPELRRELEGQLLRRYHALLVEHGVRDYGLDDCLEQYRASLLMTVYFHVLGAGVLDVSHMEARNRQTGIDWTERFFGWVEATLQDHGIVARYG